MKVVIDIDKERYTDIQRLTSVQLDDCRFKTTELIIANGIPLESVLEDIKTEIADIKDFEVVNGGVYVREYEVREIIDKYERCKG